MRALGWHGKGLPACQPHLFFRLLEKNAQRSLHHVERVVDIAVIVPRHLLAWAYLQLGDAKAWAGSVLRAALDFVKCAGVLDTFGHASRSTVIPGEDGIISS